MKKTFNAGNWQVGRKTAIVAHRSWVNAVAFHPDQKRVFTADFHGRNSLLALHRGKPKTAVVKARRTSRLDTRAACRTGRQLAIHWQRSRRSALVRQRWQTGPRIHRPRELHFQSCVESRQKIILQRRSQRQSPPLGSRLRQTYSFASMPHHFTHASTIFSRTSAGYARSRSTRTENCSPAAE